ncbi:MAG TPA: outer membrane lipoprotein chaperone LolA [Gammaproteobacteria bacterium]|nr:outer membrane lipoprotein chaperone LolA [Gammaproteobacteria bacterium]
MFRILFFLLLPLSVFATPAAHLFELLNHFQTLDAQFEQTTQDEKSHEIVAKSEGRMMIARPGKFYWETQKPTHQIVIANGNTLWIYDVDLQQAVKQSLQAGPVNPALLLSSSDAALLKQFQVTEKIKGITQTFTLTPKKNNPAFHAVALVFKQKVLNQVVIYNTLLQINQFVFTKVKRNTPLSSKQFEFVPPKGVEVVK